MMKDIWTYLCISVCTHTTSGRKVKFTSKFHSQRSDIIQVPTTTWTFPPSFLCPLGTFQIQLKVSVLPVFQLPLTPLISLLTSRICQDKLSNKWFFGNKKNKSSFCTGWDIHCLFLLENVSDKLTKWINEDHTYMAFLHHLCKTRNYLNYYKSSAICPG